MKSIPIPQMMLISDLLKGNMEQNKRLVHQSKMLGVPLDGILSSDDDRMSKQNGTSAAQVEQDMIYWQLIQKIESMRGRQEFSVTRTGRILYINKCRQPG